MSASEFIGNLIAYTILAVIFIPIVFGIVYYALIAVVYIIPPLRNRVMSSAWFNRY
jgi:hypothetical protein